MSVLIKTMTNLPEHCYDCPCHDGESGYCQADKEHRYSIYRPFWCPLAEEIKALEQQPWEDCISRQAVLDKMKERDEELSSICCRDIRELPSVIPQSKTGHWIYDDEHSDWINVTYKCSCCKRTINVPYETGNEIYKDYPYCHCGARMAESKE